MESSEHHTTDEDDVVPSGAHAGRVRLISGASELDSFDVIFEEERTNVTDAHWHPEGTEGVSGGVPHDSAVADDHEQDDVGRTDHMQNKEAYEAIERRELSSAADSGSISDVNAAIALNAAYLETIDEASRRVHLAIQRNRDSQKLLKLRLRQVREIDPMSLKKKVPVSLYIPPYFKDSHGMIPPMNDETKRKLHSGDYDPLVKESRRWPEKELEALREGVKQSLIEADILPYTLRRKVLAEKLKNRTGMTSEDDANAWQTEIESLDRSIAFLRSRPDAEIFAVKDNYAQVDFAKVANIDLLGRRSATEVRLKWINEQCPRWSKSEWTETELKHLKLLAIDRWLNWDIIADRLGTSRTAFQCFEKYKTELDLESKYRTWTKEEDAGLCTLVKAFQLNGKVQWEKVSIHMTGRTRHQCQIRYDRTLDSDLKAGRWTEEEDLMLKCAVCRFGVGNWRKAAEYVPGRSDSQCRDRWVNCLDSRISDAQWSLEEDATLLSAVEAIGKEWSKISKMLPGRPPDHCKIRFRTLLYNKIKHCNSNPKFAPFVMRRWDTARRRSGRREFVEKRFKELLGADGESEAAEKLTEEARKENLSIDDMEALSAMPPERRDIIIRLMKEIEGNVKEQLMTDEHVGQTLHLLLHQKINIHPEFLDNCTRRLLIRSYDRATKESNRILKEYGNLLTDQENIQFFKDWKMIKDPTESCCFLMDSLVDIVDSNDNIERRFYQVRDTKINSVTRTCFFLKQMLIEKMPKLESPEPVETAEVYPLAPFLGTLQLLDMVKVFKKYLEEDASELFDLAEEGSTSVVLQLSKDILQSAHYRLVKMKIKALLFWPMLLDASVESVDEKEERLRIAAVIGECKRKQQERAEMQRAAFLAAFAPGVTFSNGMSADDGPTIKEIILARRNRDSCFSNAVLSKKEVENEKPKEERLAMIDECIESVCNKVAIIFERDFCHKKFRQNPRRSLEEACPGPSRTAVQGESDSSSLLALNESGENCAAAESDERNILDESAMESKRSDRSGEGGKGGKRQMRRTNEKITIDEGEDSICEPETKRRRGMVEKDLVEGSGMMTTRSGKVVGLGGRIGESRISKMASEIKVSKVKKHEAPGSGTANSDNGKISVEDRQGDIEVRSVKSMVKKSAN